MNIKVNVSVKEIVDFLGNEIVSISGNVEGAYVDNLADVSHVEERTLDWINPSNNDKQIIAEQSKAKVLLVDENVKDIKGKILIKVKNPKHSLAKVGNEFFVQKPTPGIHPTAIIDKEAVIAQTASIGAYVVIGKSIIGENSVISSFVRVYDDVIIGRDCFIKEGAIIGGAGFGFERDDDGNRFRFPQIGGVRIGDHVEIGGNTCIDRGALSNTIIGDYVKIDNLCHIAHNAMIGNNAVIVACAEVSGSCVIGDNTWVGPNACIRDQRHVGCNTMIGMGSVVVKNVGDDEICAGNPARRFQ